MQSAAISDATRSALMFLITKEERRLGSRDVAYASVAETIGRSASWLKKYVARHAEAKELSLSVFLRIRAAYERACTRVETEHQLEVARAAALRALLHETDQGFVEMVESTSRKTTARAES